MGMSSARSELVSGLSGEPISPSTPALLRSAAITDLSKAPTDTAGLVHFTGDFSILQRVDPPRGNRRLFFDYGNRGNKRMLQFFNDAPASNDPRTRHMPAAGF